MRISIRPGDDCYDSRAIHYTPYLNGVKLDDCVMADEEKGEVVVHKRDYRGKLVLNKLTDSIETEVKKGVVRLFPRIESNDTCHSIIGIIPARYESTRFPGKPLAMVNDKPMIQWVWENAKKSRLINKLFIATDDERIVEAASKFGAQVIMTRTNHAAGTDRVREIADMMHLKDEDIVVNIQGDLPTITATDIDRVIDCKLFSEHPIATLAQEREYDYDLFNKNYVKVLLDDSSQAVFFSRHPLVIGWEGHKGNWHHHVGVYAFSYRSLINFTDMPLGEWERIARLEQLRALQVGMKIQVVATPNEIMDVNTPEDLHKVNQLLREGK